MAVDPLHADFRGRFGIVSVVSAPINGQSLSGRLFWLDIRASADELMLADILAAQVTARIDRAYLFDVLREKAAADERVRVARDLHDGLLQSLSAAGLEIEAAREVVARHSPADAERLARVQKTIATEQSELRAFVDQLKLRGNDLVDTEGAPASDLSHRVRELAEKFEQLWGAKIELRTDGLNAPLMPSLSRHAYLMISEAVSNALRHGGASTVRVEIRALAGELRLSVADDGRGFVPAGLHGDRDDGARYPESLAQRASSLKGSLSVESTGNGTRVEISLPIDAAGR